MATEITSIVKTNMEKRILNYISLIAILDLLRETY